MIISNVSGTTIAYSVKDTSNAFNDGGTLNPNSYVEFQPPGAAPFTVSVVSQPVNLLNVPSPAIVTFWLSGNQITGGFSQ